MYMNEIVPNILQFPQLVCSHTLRDLSNQYGYEQRYTVKMLKIGTPERITIIVLQLEQLDFTVQYCVQ